MEFNRGHRPIRQDPDERATGELGAAGPERGGYDPETGDGGGRRTFTGRNSQVDLRDAPTPCVDHAETTKH